MHSLTQSSFLHPQHIPTSAWLEHAPFAFWLMETLRPQLLVELGTHNGFSYFSFCQAVQQLRLPTRCYAVDTWEGDEHAGFYGEEVFATVNAINEEHYKSFSQLMRSRFDQALPYFPDNEIDLLHIDGRHGYDDVLEDFTTWQPKLSDRAVVLFHDTNVRERDFGVWKLWRELSTQYPSFEFFHCHGLGVLGVGADLPEGLRTLFASEPEEAAAVRATYSALGSAVSRSAHNNHLHSELHRIDHRANQLQHEAENLQQVLTEHRAQAQVELQAQLEAGERLRIALEQSREHSDQLLNEIQNLRGVIGEQQQQIEAGNKLRAEQETQISASSSALAEREAAMNALRDELTSERNNIAFELVNVRNQWTQQSASYSMVTQRLSIIESSTFWRASAPLRKSLKWLPSGVRRNGRRAIKAAWWAITPHRMPERLRFLRAQRTSAAQKQPLSPAAEYSDAHSPPSAPYSPMNEIGFAPNPIGAGKSGIVASAAGRYAFQTASNSYVYVPPHPPSDLDRRLAAMKHAPLFSIVVPTYNTPLDLLHSLVASVQSQWYPRWELIFVDDASPTEDVRDALRQFNNLRIRSIFSPVNRGISDTTNAAIEAATGDFVVFLDHDDELTVDCLWELALRIESEDPDFIYSDEDKIAPDGNFVTPFFKPDWSPDTMMSTMFTCHVMCVRRSVIQAVGGLRKEFDGAQDYDFVLRVVEHTSRIAHIPKVLYHWRMIPASIAEDLNAKPYAIIASRQAREAALERRGIVGTLEPVKQVDGYYRVKYDIQNEPLVSIIIPSKNNSDILKQCINSIQEKTSYRKFEILIMDNGSTEPETIKTLRHLSTQEKVRVIEHNKPFNYSEINNSGTRCAQGDIFVFLNDDTEVLSEDWLERMGGYAQRDHIGAVGAKLIYPNTRIIQHNGILNLDDGPGHAFMGYDADAPGYFMRNLLEWNWIAVTGACLMIERKKFEASGGFDERLPVSYNDVKICFDLIDNGFYNVVCSSVELIHHESLSRGRDDLSEERRERLQRELKLLRQLSPQHFMKDPFHNPNFHPDRLDFLCH